MTWCDLIYMAVVEVTKIKEVLVTRYPIDSYFNQFPTLFNISSTKDTEPMVVNNTFYKHYPKIRQDMIGINTSNLFIDTCQITGLRLPSIIGDFDGDMVSIKPLYSIEANAELMKQINSKKHYISLNGENLMVSTNEGSFAMYSLTMVLPEDESKLTKPTF